ncbi:hypothetical protein BGX20_009893, partial [Mortierella sp. AD010]
MTDSKEAKIDLEAMSGQSITIDIETLRALVPQPYTPKFNPGPLGLSAFGLST